MASDDKPERAKRTGAKHTGKPQKMTRGGRPQHSEKGQPGKSGTRHVQDPRDTGDNGNDSSR